MSQNQTNSSDDTMEILQPCVQNQGDTDAHAHPMARQLTTTSTVSDNQPQQNIYTKLVRCYNKTVKASQQLSILKMLYIYLMGFLLGLQHLID
uniref:Uncharacterized protein n=1 Tax=Magallana gigas TaxID=29159 RepID=K1RPQ7_MAGGI